MFGIHGAADKNGEKLVGGGDTAKSNLSMDFCVGISTTTWHKRSVSRQLYQHMKEAGLFHVWQFMAAMYIVPKWWCKTCRD
jgi:hypothetical protein